MCTKRRVTRVGEGAQNAALIVRRILAENAQRLRREAGEDDFIESDLVVAAGERDSNAIAAADDALEGRCKAYDGVVSDDVGCEGCVVAAGTAEGRAPLGPVERLGEAVVDEEAEEGTGGEVESLGEGCRPDRGDHGD